MTNVAENTVSPGRDGGQNTVLVIVVVLAVIGLIWLVQREQERDLDRSAVGMAGLVEWLRADDVEARLFRGGAPLVRGKIGLRILPLYDTDLDAERVPPTSEEEVIAEHSERDLHAWVLRNKVRSLPTLVVLPKWRAGMRKLRVAHRDLLIDDRDMNRLLRQFVGPDARLRRDPEDFTRRAPRSTSDLDFDSALVYAQAVRDIQCDPLVGSDQEVFLAECRTSLLDDDESDANLGDRLPPEARFWLLSDPDLLSNHGLGLGGNAETARRLVRHLKQDGPVIIDVSTSIYAVDPSDLVDHRKRTWEDFLRLFAWPFSVIWVAFFFVAALVLWRAVVRGGPVKTPPSDQPRGSRSVSIDAKARLLRLSGHDTALMRLHLRQRLQSLYAVLFGPHRKARDEPLAEIVTAVARRAPHLATELSNAVSAIDQSAPSGPGPVALLDRFETSYQRIVDEFGRPAHRH